MTSSPTPGGRLGRGAGHWARGLSVDNPGRFSPAVVRLVRYLLRPLLRVLFRPRLTGLANLPADRPCLLVSNHSAGAGIAEIGSFYALYLEQTGGRRPLAGFALPQGFHVPPMAALLKAGGAIPSSYEAAAETLDQGVSILVFPGGDHETLRPVWKAGQVDFGGRTGFLRIARDHKVPIVPMGIRGAHYTAPMLYRADWLATALVVPRLLGIKRWGISLLSVLGALAIAAWVPWSLPARALLIWLWLGSPLVFWPIIPWTIQMRIGEPLEPEALFAEDDLSRALHRVQVAVAREAGGVAISEGGHG
jgi:1-acyl-sn-glycerol-3-phosphate acyltransferase